MGWGRTMWRRLKTRYRRAVSKKVRRPLAKALLAVANGKVWEGSISTLHQQLRSAMPEAKLPGSPAALSFTLRVAAAQMMEEGIEVSLAARKGGRRIVRLEPMDDE